MKPRVYIETSVISYLTGRASRDRVAAVRQEATREWWEQYGNSYALFVSDLVSDEASEGDPQAAEQRLTAITVIPALDVTEHAQALAEHLVGSGVIPRQAASDALHVAVAALNGMDYLLTWNYRHLANASIRRKLELLVEEAGFSCPVICTPEELNVRLE